MKLPSSLSLTLLQGRSHDAMAASQALLVASGTATLEAALFKRPMVIAYKLAWLNYRIMRNKGYLPWIGLPNILCNESIVPEFVQHAATPEAMGMASLDQLESPAKRARIVERFGQLHVSLRCGCAERAADVLSRLADARDPASLIATARFRRTTEVSSSATSSSYRSTMRGQSVASGCGAMACSAAISACTRYGVAGSSTCGVRTSRASVISSACQRARSWSGSSTISPDPLNRASRRACWRRMSASSAWTLGWSWSRAATDRVRRNASWASSARSIRGPEVAE
jgi:hypothetical protein